MIYWKYYVKENICQECHILHIDYSSIQLYRFFTVLDETKIIRNSKFEIRQNSFFYRIWKMALEFRISEFPNFRIPNLRSKIRQYVRLFGDICQPLVLTCETAQKGKLHCVSDHPSASLTINHLLLLCLLHLLPQRRYHMLWIFLLIFPVDVYWYLDVACCMILALQCCLRG